MGKDNLALQIELREIVGHVRGLLVLNREMGLEPPILSLPCTGEDPQAGTTWMPPAQGGRERA